MPGGRRAFEQVGNMEGRRNPEVGRGLDGMRDDRHLNPDLLLVDAMQAM